MTFKTLAALLESHAQLQESADDMGGTGLGPKPHPILSRAELVRLGDKMEQAVNKVEEIRSIFKHVPDATGPAHKLGHIGEKGGFDMSHFNGVNEMLDKLEEAIEEMHMAWGTQVQSETGALDDDEPTDVEADADDLPAEPDAEVDAEAAPVKEGWKSSAVGAAVAVAATAGIAGAMGATAKDALAMGAGVATARVARDLAQRRKQDAQRGGISITVKRPTK